MWLSAVSMKRFQEIARLDEDLYQFQLHHDKGDSPFQKLLWQVDLLYELHIMLYPLEGAEQRLQKLIDRGELGNMGIINF